MVCPLDFLCRAANRSWIGNAPVSRHRLTRPDRADFFRSVIADSEDEVELGGVWLCKLVPTLTAEAIGWQMSILQQRDSLRSNCARGIASSTVGGKVRSAFVIHDCLGHDGASRISGT